MKNFLIMLIAYSSVSAFAERPLYSQDMIGVWEADSSDIHCELGAVSCTIAATGKTCPGRLEKAESARLSMTSTIDPNKRLELTVNYPESESLSYRVRTFFFSSAYGYRPGPDIPFRGGITMNSPVVRFAGITLTSENEMILKADQGFLGQVYCKHPSRFTKETIKFHRVQ